MTRASCTLPLAVLAACTPTPQTDDAKHTWKHLDPAHFGSIAFGGEGRVTIDGRGITLDIGSPLTGARWQGAALPTVDYEVALRATRLRGSDFFCGLTFPVRDSHCTLILGGWGGALVGLSCIDGADASENETTTHLGFDDGRAYDVRVRVTADRIAVFVDDERVIDADIRGRAVSVRADVALTEPLAVTSYATTARINDVRIRRL
ncbi:MAG: DUF1080 domain-containing protein [Planctomycetota bacterium]